MASTILLLLSVLSLLLAVLGVGAVFGLPTLPLGLAFGFGAFLFARFSL